MSSPQWLHWVWQLQSIAQAGLTYSRDPYDIERFEAIQKLAAEITAVHTNLSPSQILPIFAAESGYATPKIDVRGVVFRDEKLLLVRERSDGLWTLPGGWADVGDAPSTAVTREIAEESGFVTEAVKLLALYDRNQHPHPPIPAHTYKLFFLCRIIGGSAQTSLETDQVGFFARDAVPANLSLSRVLPQQIERCFEHLDNPAWPTDFD